MTGFKSLFWSEEYEIMEVTFFVLGTEQRAALESQRDLLRESRERKIKNVHVLFLNSLGVPVLTQAQCHLF